MSKAVILQHAPYAGPGRIVDVFGDFGIQCDTRHLYSGDEVPTDLDEVRVLVVLGGPMRVADVGSPQHPYLATEVATLKRMIEFDRPVLGIALGAQLLAHAAGAKVYPNVTGGPGPEDPKTPAPEFGWFGVTLPFPGGTEPIVYGLYDGAPMFHWHRDTFDLPKVPPPANLPQGAPPPPPGNALISSSKLCKNQAFRFKTRSFGFQYHLELTPDQIDALLAADGINALGSAEAVARVREETKQVYPKHARLGNRILTNFVQFLKAY
jgi:GMP synthase (glutamine-hydrolysing)